MEEITSVEKQEVADPVISEESQEVAEPETTDGDDTEETTEESSWKYSRHTRKALPADAHRREI